MHQFVKDKLSERQNVVECFQRAAADENEHFNVWDLSDLERRVAMGRNFLDSVVKNTGLKQCVKCELAPAITECQDCFQLLCRMCLVTDHHPETHRLVPIASNRRDSTSKAPAGYPTRQHPDHRLASTTIAQSAISDVNIIDKLIPCELNADFDTADCVETEFCCKTCRYELVTNEKQHHCHTIIDVATGTEEIKTELQESLLLAPSLIDKARSAQIETCHIKHGKLDFCHRLNRSIRESDMDLLKSVKSQISQFSRNDASFQDVLMAHVEDIATSINKRKLFLDERKKMHSTFLRIGERHPAALVNGFKRLEEQDQDPFDPEESPCFSTAPLVTKMKGLEDLIHRFETARSSSIVQLKMILEDYIKKSRIEKTNVEDVLQHNESYQKNPILDLRSATNIQLATGLPIAPMNQSNGYKGCFPYWTNLGPPDHSGLLYRIDTFHTQWELVKVALYNGEWLAIFPVSARDQDLKFPEPPGRSDGFWDYKTAVDPPRTLSWKVLDKLKQTVPPENLVSLKEVQITKFNERTQALSPVGRLLLPESKHGFEVIRCNKEQVPVGYWIFASDSEEAIEKWLNLLIGGKRKMIGQGVPGEVYVPCTNPALHPEELNVVQPMDSRMRWGAINFTAESKF